MSSRFSIVALSLSALALGACAHEQKVGMADLPPAVKATLDRETAGGTVTEIEKESQHHKWVYSADAMVNGEAWDITIAEDGTLISKERERTKSESKK